MINYMSTLYFRISQCNSTTRQTQEPRRPENFLCRMSEHSVKITAYRRLLQLFEILHFALLHVHADELDFAIQLSHGFHLHVIMCTYCNS